jgi:hypothetical protein
VVLDPVKNFARVSVSLGYDASATSIVLSTGNGAKLPSPAGDGAFNLVWWDSDYSDPSDDPNVEIVRCTARAGDTLTVTRAQEGTVATVKNLAGKSYNMLLGFTKKSYDDIETRVAGAEVDIVALETTISDWEIDKTLTNIVNIDEYDNSLSDALTDIGADEVTLIISDEVTLTESATIPLNVSLCFLQGGKIHLGDFNMVFNG